VDSTLQTHLSYCCTGINSDYSPTTEKGMLCVWIVDIIHQRTAPLWTSHCNLWTVIGIVYRMWMRFSDFWWVHISVFGVFVGSVAGF